MRFLLLIIDYFCKITEWLFYKGLNQGKKLFGDLYAKQGIKALNANDYDSAIKKLKRAVKVGVERHNLAYLYTLLGKAYERLGEYEQAIFNYKKALKIDPTYHRAWNNLGIASYYVGMLDEAEVCYQKALSIEPKYPFAYASLGAVYISRNAPEKALNVLERAIALNPTIPATHGNIALAYAMLGRFATAEAALKQAIVCGYTDWQNISDRIIALKALEQISSDGNTALWKEYPLLLFDNDFNQNDNN